MLTTDTNVALDLSPTSFGGESPVAIFGFFLMRIVYDCVLRSLIAFYSLVFAIFDFFLCKAVNTCIHWRGRLLH